MQYREKRGSSILTSRSVQNGVLILAADISVTQRSSIHRQGVGLIDMSSRLWRRIHCDQRGAVSLETILIVAAIALPILIFILKFGWPKIRDYFNTRMQNPENEGNRTQNGG